MGRNGSRRGRRMGRGRMRVGALAVLLACAMAGTLLIETGVASAAPTDTPPSVGFRIANASSHRLRVEGATPVPRMICNSELCVPTHFLFGFEGRPHNGSALIAHTAPGGSSGTSSTTLISLVRAHTRQR
jgi:hypothetical protein